LDYGFKVTTHGRAAITACMALEAPPKITRVAFGSGRISAGVDLADVHSLVRYVADGTIGRRSHKDDRLSFSVQYENVNHRDITTVFQMAEFMVYIQDPVTGKDTDFIYATLGDYVQTIPPYRSTYPAAEWALPMTVVLSSDLKVSIDAPAGLVTFEDLYAAVQEAGSPEEVDITLPTTGWVADGAGVRLDLARSKFRKEHIPFVVIARGNMQAASRCGMEPTVEAVDGALRFWAARAPTEPISATALLFLPRGLFNFRGNGSGGGTAAGVTDHQDLTGRDAAQQHPISSITGLEEAMAAKLETEDVGQALAESIQEVTRQDVTNIWNSV